MQIYHSKPPLRPSLWRGIPFRSRADVNFCKFWYVYYIYDKFSVKCWVYMEIKILKTQTLNSTWNKNLPNLNSQDQIVAHIKADITS